MGKALQGLCSVFNQIIGFSGDEFYVAPADKHGWNASVKLIFQIKVQLTKGWPHNGYVAVQCCLGRNAA